MKKAAPFKETEGSKCFSFGTRETKDKDFPVNLVLKQRGEPMVEIPCVGEFACGKVVESLAAACAAYKEANSNEPGTKIVRKNGKKPAKVG